MPTAVADGVRLADSSRKAADFLPDLSGLGYQLAQQGPDPGAVAAGQDVHQALYAKGQAGSLVKLYLFGDEAFAQTQFGLLAEALKNPSAEFLGASVTQQETPAPETGAESKGYVTATADNQGNRVWTDIYRFGRLVAIVQLLERGPGDQLEAREAVAKQIEARTQ